MSKHAGLTLWHFTCTHRAAGIAASGVVRPHPQPQLAGVELSWFTSAAAPAPAALGLARRPDGLVTCDRMAVRYRAVTAADLLPWTYYRRELPRRLVALLEAAHGARRRHGSQTARACEL